MTTKRKSTRAPARGPRYERIVDVKSAFDRRPKKPGDPDYGIGAVTIFFVLKGDAGVVQFVIGTDWYLEAIQAEIDAKTRAWDSANPPRRHNVRPNGWDVGYHSPKPMYEGQRIITEKCPYLNYSSCYYDGSGLRADEWVRTILLPQGSDGIWKALESEYELQFQDPPAGGKKGAKRS